MSSSWILTNHIQEPKLWTIKSSSRLSPTGPYRKHLRPAVLALLVAKPARRPGSHPESQSSEPRAQNMRQSRCCKISSLILPFFTVSFRVIFPVNFCKIDQKWPKKIKIRCIQWQWQLKAPFDSPTQQTSLGASDSSALGGAAARGLETRGSLYQLTTNNHMVTNFNCQWITLQPWGNQNYKQIVQIYPNLLTSDPNGTMALWNALCNPSFLTEASTVPPMTSACPQGLARGPVHCSCGPRSPWSPPSSAPLPERDDAEESATGIAASRVQSRGKIELRAAEKREYCPYWSYCPPLRLSVGIKTQQIR